MLYTSEEPTQDESGIWSDGYNVDYFWGGPDHCLLGYQREESGNTFEVEPWRHGKERKDIDDYMRSLEIRCNDHLEKNQLTDLILICVNSEAGFVQIHFESNKNFVPPYENIYLEFYYGYLINSGESVVEFMFSEFSAYLIGHYDYAKSKRVSNSFKEKKKLLCNRLQLTISKLDGL